MSARIGLRRRHRRHKRAALLRRTRRRYVDSALDHLRARHRITSRIYDAYRERHISPEINIPYLSWKPSGT